MYFIIPGVGAIVFLHAFPLTDIQCYRYRLRHPHPDKVIWNNCRTTGGRESTQIWFRYMRELSYSAYSSLNITTDLVGWKANWIMITSTTKLFRFILSHMMKRYCGVIITFAVISFLLLRASFQTGANDNSSELMMGKNENNAFNAEPCDRDYYGLGE